jgi:hypothetical protein
MAAKLVMQALLQQHLVSMQDHLAQPDAWSAAV